MKKSGCVLLVLACVLVCAISSWGQSQTTTGTVQGDVLDEKGGSVAGATVEAKNLDTNFAQTEKTNSDGHFAFLSLAPGRYELTIRQAGFATVLQQNVNLTVGQVITIPVTMKISTVSQQVVVSEVPLIEVTQTESTSTLDEAEVSNTPVLGRKFEDLLTLTPGVAVTQGPDGDEINFNGQRGIFNNISLDGGDYNNGFFGEQMGGQRAAIDITLEAVKEFQVVASGANPEFGRTAGGVVNVVTKSGTNDLHGSAFEYFRTEALTAATSDGKPLQNFRRNQFGGSIGGPVIKDKLFFFAASEGIREDLDRPDLSAPTGTPCSVANPVFGSNITDAQISASADCQRLTLLNFMQTQFKENDGLPVDHAVRNASIFGRMDYNLNTRNQVFGSYNFDWSKNTNQTFDVPDYGTTANGIEGPSKIQAVNGTWLDTISTSLLNELHFTYSRENRPRQSSNTSAVPDTAMGFGGPTSPTFRFGQPFFLEPTVDELLWRTQVRDNFSWTRGKHTFKFGGEELHTNNTQIFRGFFTGRYLFDSPVGFMHYVTQGPTVQECSDGTFVVPPATCAGGATFTGGPLLLYLQHGPATQGETFDQSGFSSLNNDEFALFAQDTWKVTRNFTFNYGLRWEAQHFPSMTIKPSQAAYGQNLSNPKFPSDGTIHNQNKMFQPRVGFAWDIHGNGKSALRASWGIFNARQNMLTQVGAITTNGVQQQSFAAGSAFGTPPAFGQNAAPILNPPPAGTPPPPGESVTVFSKDYANPRIYTTNIGYEQELLSGWAGYIDLTISKGVHLTRFIQPNVCCSSADLVITANSDVNPNGPTYTGAAPFANLGAITDTVSSAKSLYRGATLGVRKRFSRRLQLDANYVYSEDLDDDSDERDPFTFRYLDLYNLGREYSYSDRDEKHKFNFITVSQLPKGFDVNVRMQAHTAQPTSANPSGTGTGPICSANNALHRVLLNPTTNTLVDCGRNFLRKDNGFFTFDFGAQRPIPLGDRFRIVPKVEVFNLFNNKNLVNTLSTPALFNFDGFLRQGVGDPRQAQLAVRLEF
jgi:Carboxypeptidase regulatory-like domain/TonB dependent receptor/TonB-dependent Receptor Plug Domain